MGVKAVTLTLFILAVAYLALSGGELEFNLHTGTPPEADLWTNQNFTQASTTPLNHKGDRVSLDLLAFNHLNISGKTGLEAYMGGQDRLEANPMDSSRRVYISYNPGIVQTPIRDGGCIHVDGTIQGQATITTLGGATFNVTYIQATTLVPINCNPKHPGHDG